MVMEGDSTWGVKHTVQFTDGVLWNGTPDTYIILLTNVTPINLIEKKFLKRETTLKKAHNHVNYTVTQSPPCSLPPPYNLP